MISDNKPLKNQKKHKVLIALNMRVRFQRTLSNAMILKI